LVFSCDRSRVREDGGTITIGVFVHYVNGLEFKKKQNSVNLVCHCYGSRRAGFKM